MVAAVDQGAKVARRARAAQHESTDLYTSLDDDPSPMTVLLYKSSAANRRGRAGTLAAACRRQLADDATPAHVAEAVELGLTIAEFPTTCEAPRAARDRGMAVVMGAPDVVRGGSHSGNIAAADLAKAGLLDILSFDYAPVSLLQAVFVLHGSIGLALPEAVAKASRNPAHVICGTRRPAAGCARQACRSGAGPDHRRTAGAATVATHRRAGLSLMRRCRCIRSNEFFSILTATVATVTATSASDSSSTRCNARRWPRRKARRRR